MLIRKTRVLSAAFLMLLAGVQAQSSVTLSTQSLCAVIGSSVKIPCRIQNLDYYTPTPITQKEWYRVGSSKGALSEDPQYSSRVSVGTRSFDCELTLSNVRHSDSGDYNFRFKSSQWIAARPGVRLTVTDLKVAVYGSDYSYRTLSCLTTCTLPYKPSYIWYKNGQKLLYENGKGLHVNRNIAGSYSCAVEGHGDLRSPAVCVFGDPCWSVTYSTQTICSLIGSSVEFYSNLTFPKQYKVTKMIWFVKGQSDTAAVDVREVGEYRGRVRYTDSSQNHCGLTISNLMERDAQTYKFRFYTDDPTGKYTGEPGVSLSITDLKVAVFGSYSSYKKLSCLTTCTLPYELSYIWYKNGQKVRNENGNKLHVNRKNAGSYSCAVEGHEDLRSPAVCVFGDPCRSVTYSTQTICSLIGSSVEFYSNLTFPKQYKVTKMIWFVKGQSDTAAVDVQEVEEYRGRVRYTDSSQNHCGLTISNLTERDAQTYKFRFYTDDSPTGKYTGEPGVSLSITDLKVAVFGSYSSYKKLSCLTTCTLPYELSYIWYKNGQKVRKENGNILHVYRENAGSYSCAVEGHEDLRSPAVYPPRNTAAVVLPSGDTVEGDSVTLSCRSDANPPVVTYTWFRQNAAADTLLTTGQNYSISNISSQHSGRYHCTAHNQLGHHNSTPTHLDVLYPPRNTAAVVLPSGDTVEGDSVTLSCSSDANPPDLTYTWFRQNAAADTLLTTGQKYSISNISSQHSGRYHCTAHNQLGHHNSTPTRLDVLYPPRNLSVSVVPSASGDSITLLCTSDSNPISSYTWYRKTPDGVIVMGNGTKLTLLLEEDGVHYCTARNGLGSTTSSEWPRTSDNRAVIFVAFGLAVALVLIFIAVFLWMRRRAPTLRIRSNESSSVSYPGNHLAPVYGNVSAVSSFPTQTDSAEDEGDLHYTSVYFRNSHTQEVPLYSAVQLPKAFNGEDEVEYAAVSLVKSRTLREDEIYSNLSKE